MREISRNTIPIRPGRQDERNLRAKGFSWFTYRIAAKKVLVPKKRGAGVELPPSFAALFFEKADFRAQIAGFFKKCAAIT